MAYKIMTVDGNVGNHFTRIKKWVYKNELELVTTELALFKFDMHNKGIELTNRDIEIFLKGISANSQLCTYILSEETGNPFGISKIDASVKVHWTEDIETT